ncbi:DUF4232 domain-containing protein [Streptomyces sp. NBC_01022]|uniref:DUF4232 domain-containing protein n=1 Tax=Streptomyces sp. NBC_01022 TaxID=2903723 RepID=UPI002DDC43A4|nr:DUF4232 domain-containing protein [Streptomyces sp. NBC_01022]WRZ79674.1 DUF4232 domain-containing protein [Streptomyces sp. NBC_01022]
MIRRHVLVPIAIVSFTAVATGCGGTSASAGPPGATGTVPGGSAQEAEIPSGGASSAPASATVAPEESAAQDPATGRATAGAGSAARRCTADGLTMRLGRADAGAGQIYYRLTFANKSTTACTLRGFPGVSLIRRDGSAIGVPAEREGAMRDRMVIGPGKKAEVTLHTLNQGITDSGCWSRPDYLRVYPPGSKDALTLRASQLHICGNRFTTTAVDR